MRTLPHHRILWTADRSGIGHATLVIRPARTLCGQIATSEAYGWPVRFRCDECARELERMAEAEVRR